jgi:hypothetical protein
MMGDNDMILGGKQIAVLFILTNLSHNRMVSQTIHCSHADAEKADYEASRVRTWDKLYHSYLHYSGCDDGSIWEGYSDSTVRMLAYHWDTLPQAFPLFASDAGFHIFVLKHIDPTTANDDLKMIRANAIRSCPTGGNEYCVQIRKAAENALHENGIVFPSKSKK